jgi:phospho-N-acetylmuramoyl-pentapeptide-transferase
LLYWLLYQKGFLVFHIGPFRIFRYLTFRTVFASLTALFIGLIIGPAVVRRLREFQIGQYIREDGPKDHLKKAGTPTMGGLLIVVGMIVPTLLWADLSNRFVWIAVLATLSFGAIGFTDDYLKVVHRRNLGLTARSKLLYQFLAAFVIGAILSGLETHGLYSTRLIVPFLKHFRPDLMIGRLHHGYLSPLAFLPFLVFVAIIIVGSSNAVNLTDGLDGLAIGCTVIAAGALAMLTYVSGHAVFADYLELSKMPQVSEVTIFCGSMVGSAIGFLWYNAHPAEVFMGDVGSLALGGAIGTVAVIIKQELLLPFIGGVFVIEALSVILQVGSYKLRRKRIFKMAPIHHHFELMGWSESKVIVRFWIASLVFALFALTTLKLR